MGKAVRAEPDEEGPLRTCIVTREKRAPEDMIRFVAGPDGSVVADLKRNLPGRGVWVTCAKDLVAQAVRKQAFGRSLKTQVKAAESLPDDIDRLIEKEALQALSIANKAGSITCGAAKIEQSIVRGLVACLAHASDGSPDGVRKLDQTLARHRGQTADRVPTVNHFASAQLDLALGRTNVIHAAVKRGPAADFFLSRCRRLTAYRTLGGSVGTEASLARIPDLPENAEPTASDFGL